jgi:hypothetical protein
MTIHFTDYTVEVYASGVWTALDKDAITEVSCDLSLSSNSTNPLAPGDDSDASARFTILHSAATFAWLHTPVRITFQIDGGSSTAFVGVITERASDGMERSFVCKGIDQLIRTTKLHSPVFERHAFASRTTLTSVEDPADPSWQGGVLNWIMWQCGGRPLQQAASYPSAVFYYDFDASVLDCRYIWVAGDDAWQEAQKMCGDSGGRLYQQENGVVAYRSPLKLNSSTTGAALDNASFGSIEEQESADQVANTIIVPYTRRFLLSSQEVLNDTVPRVIRPSDSITVELTPRWPVYRYDSFSLTITDAMGNPLPNDSAGYTYTTDAKAQLVTLVITNHRSTPVTLRKLVSVGSPLAPGEAAEARAGSGAPERAIQASEFVQTEQHAQRLARLLLDLYAPTPTRTIRGAVYDPASHLGDIKAVTDADLGLNATPHLITSRSDDGGETVTYTMVSTAHLPALSDLLVIDTTYSDTAVTKKLSY